MPIKRQRFGMRDFPLLHEPLAASHARRDGMTESCETNEGGRVMEERLRGERLARVLLFVTPLFFASNMLVARATADFMSPVALAFGRWFFAAIILLSFIGPSVWRARRQILAEWLDLTLLGALGMGVCGAFVYIGADTTSATNIGLIYSTSPALIILLSRFVFQERLRAPQWLGVALALAGMLVIVFRGSLETLLALRLTEGDLWIAASSLAWAVYSILLQARPGKLEPRVRFAAIILFGTLVLAPFLVLESLFFQPLPFRAEGFAAMLFLAIVPALGAYGSYGYMQRHLGASKTGLILYLSPAYTAVLAWMLLGEALQPFHLAGAACVLPGIWLATRKERRS
jgi:drug/metabolite transporter (DMT)-like permease